MSLFRMREAHRETGLPKETLRAWERRYAFPQPTRDASGDRLYTPAEIEKLRLLKKLVDRGMRPSSIIGRSMLELREMLADVVPRATHVPDAVRIDPFLQAIKRHDDATLRASLGDAMHRQGLELFIVNTIAPLTTVVGSLWMAGEFEVFEEHLYSETVQNVLRGAIATLPARSDGPTVLLTTLPGEQHQLGLLMAHALLALEGARCISLGLQTPPLDIARGAIAHEADLVALSIAESFSPAELAAALDDLERHLPASIRMWIGGSGARLLRRPSDRVRVLPGLPDIRVALQAWRTNNQTLP